MTTIKNLKPITTVKHHAVHVASKSFGSVHSTLHTTLVNLIEPYAKQYCKREGISGLLANQAHSVHRRNDHS
jgi:hypothetical protein